MSWKTDNIISPRTVRNDSWIWQISTILDVPSDLAKVYKRILKFSSESGPFCPILDAAVLFRTFSPDFGSPDLISGTSDPNLDTSDFESFCISFILAYFHRILIVTSHKPMIRIDLAFLAKRS